MYASFKGLLIIAALIVTITIFAGCAVKGLDLIDSGKVSVERVKDKYISFSYVHVYQQGENICVTGRVLRRKHLPKLIKGHVDVLIISPTGSVLKKVGVYPYPRTIPGKRTRGSYFEIHIPAILSNGSKVRFKYHNTLEIPQEELLLYERIPSSEPKTKPDKGIYLSPPNGVNYVRTGICKGQLLKVTQKSSVEWHFSVFSS